MLLDGESSQPQHRAWPPAECPLRDPSSDRPHAAPAEDSPGLPVQCSNPQNVLSFQPSALPCVVTEGPCYLTWRMRTAVAVGFVTCLGLYYPPWRGEIRAPEGWSRHWFVRSPQAPSAGSAEGRPVPTYRSV